MPTAPMTTFAPADILHPHCRQLFEYWRSIRSKAGTPLRSDIDLGEIRRLLPWVFVSEPGPATGEHHLRLAGTGICRMWQDNLTGKPPFPSWDKLERRALGDLLRGAMEGCRPFAMRIHARTATGCVTGLEIMGLPVKTDAPGRTQVWGIVAPFRQPEWLDRDRLIAFELSSVRVLVEEDADGHRQCGLPRPKPALEVISGGKGH